MNKLITLLLIVVSLTSFTVDQSKSTLESFEGIITYSSKALEVPDEYEDFKGMINNVQKVYIKGDRVKIEIINDFETSFVIRDRSTGEMAVSTTIEDEKYLIIFSPDDLKANKDDREPVIKYYSDKKQVAGYYCQKAKVTLSSGNESIVYYTTAIDNRLDGFGELSGMPFEYTIDENGYKLNYTVTSVEKKSLPYSAVDIPDGYDVMPYKEYKRKYGSE